MAALPVKAFGDTCLAGMNVNETKIALSEKISLQRTLIQLRVRRHLIVAVTYFNRTPHLI